MQAALSREQGSFYLARLRRVEAATPPHGAPRAAAPPTGSRGRPTLACARRSGSRRPVRRSRNFRKQPGGSDGARDAISCLRLRKLPLFLLPLSWAAGGEVAAALRRHRSGWVCPRSAGGRPLLGLTGGRGERASGRRSRYPGLSTALAAALPGPGPERGCRRRRAAILGAALRALRSLRELRGSGSAGSEWAAGSRGQAGGRERGRECAWGLPWAQPAARGEAGSCGITGLGCPTSVVPRAYRERRRLRWGKSALPFLLGCFRLEKARSVCSDGAQQPSK